MPIVPPAGLVQFWIQALSKGDHPRDSERHYTGSSPTGVFYNPTATSSALRYTTPARGLPNTGDEVVGGQPGQRARGAQTGCFSPPRFWKIPQFHWGESPFVADSGTVPMDIAKRRRTALRTAIWSTGCPLERLKNGRRYKTACCRSHKDLEWPSASQCSRQPSRQIDSNFAVTTRNRKVTTHNSVLTKTTRRRFQATESKSRYRSGQNDYAHSQQYILSAGGLGFGPSEGDFRSIFNDDAQLFNPIYYCRYAIQSVPGGEPGTTRVSNKRRLWNQLRHRDPKSDLAVTPLLYSSDVWGRAALAVD